MKLDNRMPNYAARTKEGATLKAPKAALATFFVFNNMLSAVLFAFMFLTMFYIFLSQR
jgi:hypothetical protein